MVGAGVGVDPGDGAGGKVGLGDGAGVGVDPAAALGDGAGDGVGMVVAVGAGARDEVRGDDGAGAGCEAPAGTLEVAAVDRRTAQVTRPQNAVRAWARPPDSCSRTTTPEPPSRTKPTAAHVTGRHP
jgi:hypothetical protein